MNEDQQRMQRLLLLRRAQLGKLAAYREQIDKAAEGKDLLPDFSVLRALCSYVSGDFVLWIDAWDVKDLPDLAGLLEEAREVLRKAVVPVQESEKRIRLIQRIDSAVARQRALERGELGVVG